MTTKMYIMEKIEVKNELATAFREQLYKLSRKENIGSIYEHLFSFKTDDDLQKELEYLYTLYKGTDKYFKTESIDCWFWIWHKSIRQSDYFKDCYKITKIDLVTEEERKEFKFLSSVCKAKGFSKTEGKEENKLFNETYSRYLELHQIIIREGEDVSIAGELDSMLWNLIHVDKENKLQEVFLNVFKILD